MTFFGKLSSQTVIFDDVIYSAPRGYGPGAYNSVHNLNLDKYGRVYLNSITYLGAAANCCFNWAVKTSPWTNFTISKYAGIFDNITYVNFKPSLYFYDNEYDAFRRKNAVYTIIPFAPTFQSKVFIDKNDFLFVSNGDSIYKLDSTGVIVSAFDIDVDYITGDEQDNLFIITDSLRKYNSAGMVLWSYPYSGSKVVVDSIGNSYFYKAGSLTKLNQSGNVDFIRPGIPTGLLAVDQFYNIYIANSNYLRKYNATADTLFWLYPLTEIYTALSVDLVQNCYLGRIVNEPNEGRAYLKVLRTIPPPDSILITQVSDSVFCSGDSLQVYFDVIGPQNYANGYKVELSNSSGSFSNGVAILGYGSGSPINTMIFPSIASSANYLIRVVPTFYSTGINSQPFPITIYKPQTITFGIANFYGLCSDSPPVDINPQPAGGILTGAGIYGTTFYPDSVSIPGSFVINYSMIDSNGCVATATAHINAVINPLSSVSLITSADSLCKGDTLHLTGIPGGGYYQGTGLTTNIFYSDSTSMVDNLVKYSKATVTYGVVCVTSTSKILHVFPQDSIIFILPHDTICPMEPPFLISATPGGGVLSGNALFGQTFYPDSAVVLAFNPINYTYTNAFGCENNATDSVYVFDSPILSIIQAVDSLCTNESIILEGIPAGGYFSGQGMTDSTFIAINGTAGQNNITYNYSNSFGCENSISTAIYVYPAIEINFNLAADTVCINTPPFLINVTPAGGILSGDGIVGNIFYPDSIGAGLSSIYYTILSNDGCTYQSVDTIYVDYCLSSPYMDGSVETIKIFPNPVSDVITIKSSSSLKNAIIQILDSNGRSVYEGNFSGTLETVNVSKLIEGLYLFKILDNSEPIFSEKISVLRR